MGHTPETITKGLAEAAGAVQRSAEQGKDAALRGVDTAQDAVARSAEKIKDNTARAAEQVKDASRELARRETRHASRTGVYPTACASIYEGEHTMSTPMRAHVWSGWWGGLLVVGSLLGGGCTAGSPPVALEQARTAYAQAEQMPAVATNAPVPLREAQQALQRAEREWSDHHDPEEVQHLAALAQQFSFWPAKGLRLPMNTDMVKVTISIRELRRSSCKLL